MTNAIAPTVTAVASLPANPIRHPAATPLASAQAVSSTANNSNTDSKRLT